MEQLLRLVRVLSAVTSLVFLVVIPGWYFWLYHSEQNNPYRLEYLHAVGTSLLLLAPIPVIVFLTVRVFLHKYRT